MKTIVSGSEVFILLAALVALFALSSLQADRQPFASAEVQFTDPSARGLSIVPASCPSYPHSSEDCLAPSFESFAAIDGNGNPFTASGHLQVVPSLVRAGDPVRLYWNVVHVVSCAITGTNGDTWSTSSSGSTGQVSSPITAQTVFNLHCLSQEGVTPAYVDESVTVLIAPIFDEF